MTTIAPGWLTAPATQTVLAALAPATPFFVGGCVRDALMGRTTQDIDIAVTTPPAETMQLAEAASLTAHPTGIDHGVVTIIANGAPFEVATLRRDVATDGRRAVVAFSTDIAEDAARRDFTMNALYADGAGHVIDPLGSGLADLAARRLRFIGDADQRIREDYLRILRFFRFHAQFQIGSFDQTGLTACQTLAGGLAQISRERIGAEMLKLLAAPDPEPTLAAMGEALTIALPGAVPFQGLTARETEMGLSPSPHRPLAALGGDNPQAALRLSNADAAHLKAIKTARALPLAEAAYRHGKDAATDALALAATPPPGSWKQIIQDATAARFPVTANDLMTTGAKPGPKLGETLKTLEAGWIASNFTLTKTELLAGKR